MKVCFISHSSAKYGAERALLELIDALRARGVEIYVLLPSFGPLVEELKSRGITFHVLPYRAWMGVNPPIWKRIVRTILNLSMIIPVAIKIAKWGCDIIYTNTITICVGALAAKLLGRPHVWHIHEFGYEDHRLTYDLGTKLSLWLIHRLSSFCIVNSNTVAQKYRQFIPERKLKVIYQSVSIKEQGLSEFIDLKKQSEEVADINCVIVGGLAEGKGQEDAVKAIGELMRMGVKANLFIVGGGNPKYKQYLQNLAVQENIESYVKFLGWVDNPFPIMCQADIVLMCSRFEAFGRVTVEAMRAGKPVIGARSGGTIELIRDGFNGLLYTPGDYRELARKILYLYEHSELAQQMGKSGQRWVAEQFTEEYYGEEVLANLKQLVSRRYR